VDFFAVQATSGQGARTLTGALFVGDGRLRFESRDASLVLVDPATLAGFEVKANGEAHEVDGFQGVKGAITQIGLSPYWLPTDPENPCARWLGTECKSLGADEVDGRAATKWEVIHYVEDTGIVSYVWVDRRLHIVSRTVFGGHTSELRDVIEISQPSSLFEAPVN
jgi:hypothetical protein